LSTTIRRSATTVKNKIYTHARSVSFGSATVMGRQQRSLIHHSFPALCLIATICLVAMTTSTTTTTTAADSSFVARDRVPGGSRATGTTTVAYHNHRNRRYIILTPVRQQQQSLSVKSQKTLVRMRTFDQKYGKLFPYMRKMDRNNRLWPPSYNRGNIDRWDDRTRPDRDFISYVVQTYTHCDDFPMYYDDKYSYYLYN